MTSHAALATAAAAATVDDDDDDGSKCLYSVRRCLWGRPGKRLRVGRSFEKDDDLDSHRPPMHIQFSQLSAITAAV